jgi:hypothetical protein
MNMSVSVIVALIAAGAALLTSIVSLVSQRRVTTLQNELTLYRDRENRAIELDQVMARYRQPLLQSATDLQSRLYNIVRGNLLQIYGRGTTTEQTYTVENTLFVFGEYFGWVEALRREVQFLDSGNEERNRQVQSCLESIASAFLRDDLENEFRLFRGEQRAIGEVMLVARNGNEKLECVGFAAFTKRLAEPDVARWFAKLREDLNRLCERSTVSSNRIALIQGSLIDLLDCLDPNSIRVPNRRKRLSTTLEKN